MTYIMNACRSAWWTPFFYLIYSYHYECAHSSLKFVTKYNAEKKDYLKINIFFEFQIRDSKIWFLLLYYSYIYIYIYIHE